MTEDVTLIGVYTPLVPRTGNKGEDAAVVKSAFQLCKALVNGRHYTNCHEYIVPVDLYRHSVLDVILEMALKR